MYSEEDFYLLKEHAKDSDRLDDTYEDFLSNAQRYQAFALADGIDARFVNLTFAEIEEHCRQTGKPNNGTTRAEFGRDRGDELFRAGDLAKPEQEPRSLPD